MKKLIYYIKRIFGMDYKQFFITLNKVHKRSNKSRIYLFFDMLYSSYKYLAGYTDYFLFYFENLNKKQRSTYITRGVNNNYLRYLNNRDYYKYFRNKVLFNDKFKEFIKRDYLDLNQASIDDFKEFTSKHNTFIVKPIDDTGGHGVEKITINKSTHINSLYKDLLNNNQALVEECVIQHKDMAALAEKSVNTLRIVTITINGKTHIMLRVIRIGNGINAVDNFHSGGMFAYFDENGIITTPAADREGIVYENHPYTNVKIQGYKIPFHKEAIEMAIEASKVIPEIRYIGFDIAITKDGPVIIEGNELPGYDVYQSKLTISDTKEGLKPYFDKIIYKNQK